MGFRKGLLVVVSWTYAVLATCSPFKPVTLMPNPSFELRQQSKLFNRSHDANGKSKSVYSDDEHIDLVVSDNLANTADDVLGKIVHKPYNPQLWKQPSSKRDSYVFNATAKDNVVVYFGQTSATNRISGLQQQCADPAVDIVILAFVRYAYDSTGSGYPKTTFGSACGSEQTPEMAAHAPGLQFCTNYIPQIQGCQEAGKKIFISVGGSTSAIAMSSPAEAIGFATMLWNLFGGGTDPIHGNALRPFGNLTIDGFDLGQYHMKVETTHNSHSSRQ
jgi:hypothetical protein